MDVSIGKLLDAIKDMGEEENTIIVFTSDNGPEESAGNTGLYHGRKRSLKEGGIRVPAIIQWVNHIPAGRRVHHWTSTIDLFPTFLEAAKVKKPTSVQWDGLSFLSFLIPRNNTRSSFYTRTKNWITGNYNHNDINLHHSRVFLWHKITEIIPRGEPPNKSAAYYQQLKVIVKNDGINNGCVEAIYDHRYDHYEDKNIAINNEKCLLYFDSYTKLTDPNTLKTFLHPDAANKHCVTTTITTTDIKGQCKENYLLDIAKKISIMLSYLRPFVIYGNQPYHRYILKDHNNCKIPLITDLDYQYAYFDTKTCVYDYKKLSSCTVPLY